MNNKSSIQISYGDEEIKEANDKLVTLPHPSRLLNQDVVNNNTTTTMENRKKGRDYTLPFVSICVCMKNAEKFIDETLLSVIQQTYNGPIELSIYDDLSTDTSVDIIKSWSPLFNQYEILLIITSPNNEPIIYHHNIDYYLNHCQTTSTNNNNNINNNNNNSNDNNNNNNNTTQSSKGVGYSRNRAIQSSHGDYLCILDADDIMMNERIEYQLQRCLEFEKKDDHSGDGNNNNNNNKHVIVGSQFMRIPSGSSARYTDWCNRLTENDLYLHQYRECTLIQPTWFMNREVYTLNGPFAEPTKEILDKLYKIQDQQQQQQQQHQSPETTTTAEDTSSSISSSSPTITKQQPIPEDLLFFHKHLDNNGKITKVDKPLLIYRYHPDNLSKQIHRLVLLKIRLEHLERRVLNQWKSFSIWGVGRDGKKFFTMLSKENKDKVASFCDVDLKKIGTKHHCSLTGHNIPIIHWSQVKPPIILCVSLDRTNTEFENNLKSLNLVDGVDYWHFN